MEKRKANAHALSLSLPVKMTQMLFFLPIAVIHTSCFCDGDQANLSLREKPKNMKCTKNMNIFKNLKGTWNIIH